MADGTLILIAGALLAAGLAASLLAGRLRVPALVLFLGVGMAVGSDGTGWIEFGDYRLARTIGVIALAAILFEGGLAAGFGEIRPVLRPALGLAVVGTLLTALIVGLAASWLLHFSTLEGLLVGSVLASTDGAAIFSLLRGSTLRRRLALTLEGEAGLNDPIAVLLVLGFISAIQEPGFGAADFLLLLVRQLAIGAAVGGLVGWLAVEAFRRARLTSAGLYPVASIATIGLAFGGADVLHGSGFLAVYLAGLSLGSVTIPARGTVAAFHQGLAWVAQMAMFLTLGLLVVPSKLGDVALKGTLVSLVLVFVARPIAAVAATAWSGFQARERLVLGWAGLRGAVPVVLATFPVIAGVPGSRDLFNVVFFAVLISTLLQGSSFEALARRLGVTTSAAALASPLIESGTIRRLGAQVIEFPVAAGDALVGRRVRELGLPREALVNLIVRDDEAVAPRGSTRIAAGDRLHVLLRHEASGDVEGLLERWRTHLPERVVRRPAVRGSEPVFTVRPWRERDGDADRPAEVLGVGVLDHLRTRRGGSGALLALEDGRYAVTGDLLVVGAASQVRRYARRRAEHVAGERERGWWREVSGALSAPD